MSVKPWLGTPRPDAAPTPLAAALRSVDPPATSSVFPPAGGRSVAATDGATAAELRELARLRADLAGARARAEAEGRAAAQAETAALREQLASAAEQLGDERARLIQADAAQLVDLALVVAGALLGRALAADADALRATVERALASAGDAPDAILRCHPSQAAAIAPHVPASLRVEPDPQLAAGEVRVETERAVIDGTAAARLAAVRDHLVAILEESC